MGIFTLIFFGCQIKEKSLPDNQPNFLFIIVDDLGYYDLSIRGTKFYETPNVDKIASSGLVFNNGYATSAVCSPSRASFLTGRFTATHGITDWIGAASGTEWRKQNRFNQLLPAEYQHHLPHEYTTIPEALKENGYRTFFAGKWHLGGEENHSLPQDHGFEINKGGYHVGSPANGRYFSPFENPYLPDQADEKGLSLSMRLARETSQFIKEKKDEKFFALLSFYAVHAPIETTQQKWKKYRDKAEANGIASKGFEMEKRLPIRDTQDNPVYAGLVEQMDDAVGHVLMTLEELGLDKNTVIIFVSDHGGVSSGDAFATSNLPLRGGKGYQWEGGIKIPYFISAPFIKSGSTDVVVTGADLYPTILEMAGIPAKPNEQIDGVSLVTIFNGGDIEPRSLIWHYPHYGNQGGDPNSIIRKGDWKLIHYWEDDHDELYNLNSDPYEGNDLAVSEKEKVSLLRNELMEQLKSRNAQLASQDSLYDESVFAQALEKRKQSSMERLEKSRLDMLSENYTPNEDWWGSQVMNAQ